MNIKHERAEFEAWHQHHHGIRDVYALDVYALDESGEYADKKVQGAFNVWKARAALQSQDHPNRQGRVMDKLFCDLKTDEEKAAFFLSGRGYETGVISQAIQNDVAMAYQRCAEYRKELEALQSQDEDIFSPTSLTGLSKDELIRQLQWALNYWMPNIADDGTPDGERAAREAYLLLGMRAPVGREEENTPTYWERVSDLQSQDRDDAPCRN